MTELFQTLITGLIIGMVYGIIAIGFTVCYETTGVLNFAQGDLVGLGAYIIFEAIGAGWPLIPSILVGVLAVGLMFALFERVVIRPLIRRGMIYAIISTIGLSAILESLIQELWGPTPIGVKSVFSSNTVKIWSVRISPENIFGVVLSLCLVVVLFWAIERTRVGRGLQTIARDRTVAALVGIHEGRMGFIGYGLAGGLAAVAGLLLGPTVGLTPTMGLNLGVVGFTAAALGGLGSVSGALVGGVVVGIGEAMIGSYVSPGYASGFTYGMLVLILLVRPQGLLGELQANIRAI